MVLVGRSHGLLQRWTKRRVAPRLPSDIAELQVPGDVFRGAILLYMGVPRDPCPELYLSYRMSIVMIFK